MQVQTGEVCSVSQFRGHSSSLEDIVGERTGGEELVMPVSYVAPNRRVSVTFKGINIMSQ